MAQRALWRGGISFGLVHVPVEETEADERPKAQVIDLMEALRGSLKLRTRHGARAAPAKRARKRA